MLHTHVLKRCPTRVIDWTVNVGKPHRQDDIMLCANLDIVLGHMGVTGKT